MNGRGRHRINDSLIVDFKAQEEGGGLQQNEMKDVRGWIIVHVLTPGGWRTAVLVLSCYDIYSLKRKTKKKNSLEKILKCNNFLKLFFNFLFCCLFVCLFVCFRWVSQIFFAQKNLSWSFITQEGNPSEIKEDILGANTAPERNSPHTTRVLQ